MSVTYYHDRPRSRINPAPLTFDALSAAGKAVADAALKGASPLTREPDIMGLKLSPSPELFAQGAGTLDVDYADGITRTFDVDVDGTITPRRYAYAFAVVFETDRPLTEEERGEAIDECSLPDSLGASIRYASTPIQRPVSDCYGDQPTSNPDA